MVAKSWIVSTRRSRGTLWSSSSDDEEDEVEDEDSENSFARASFCGLVPEESLLVSCDLSETLLDLLAPPLFGVLGVVFGVNLRA